MITNEQQHKIMDVINSRAESTHGEVKIHIVTGKQIGRAHV